LSSADRDRVRRELLEHTAAAAREARMIRECRPPRKEYIRDHLRAYILAKYMLPEGQCGSNSIRELTEASLAYMMQVSPELVAVLDTARSCAGATSATVKKALLLQAMERELDIQLPAAEAVAAPDIDTLAGLITGLMTDSDGK